MSRAYCSFLINANKMADKIRRMSRVRRQDTSDMDTVAYARRTGDGRRAFDIVLEAQQHYDNMSRFRKDRERCKRYTYGDQWKDRITVEGKDMTEEDYIRSEGQVPLKNNLIRRLVRNVLGVYRSQSKEPTCTARDRDEQKLGETMSTVLQCNMQRNRMNELYPETLEEFLISGLAVHHKSFGWKSDKGLDCWTRSVSPDMFFMDAYSRDVRGWDVSFIGEIHDIDFNSLVGEFAHSPEDYRRLADIYSSAHARNKGFVSTFCNEFGHYRRANIDFLVPQDITRCRVIEVWRKESKPRYRCHDYSTGEVYKIDVEDYQGMVLEENARRIERGTRAGIPEDDVAVIDAEWFIDDYWYYYYLTPFGDILKEGETPYRHGSHPYVFKAYPFIDGEIHSFVADFIDQQRYTNRLITMYDWIMRASAKGLLIFPEECLPDDWNIEDVAEEWHKFNGVIVVKTKNNPSGKLPQQVAANSTNIGITDLLNLQLKFFEDISGVNGALQGKPGYSGMSASLYAQQTQNSTTSLLDLLERFSAFVIDAAYKDVKNIQQFYDSKRYVNIAGRSGAEVVYDPDKLSDVEFDLGIMESTTTPVYRQMANDFLMEIWKTGQISLEQLLEHGDFPFADNLLQSIKSQKEDIAQGKIPDGLSPQMQQQVRQGANMGAVNMLHDAISAEAMNPAA